MSQISTKFIKNNAVTNSQLAQMPSTTVKGNNVTGTANPIDLTMPQLRVMLRTDGSFLTWGTTGTFLGLGAPTATTENGINVYAFSDSQILSAVLQVPWTYVVGNPIKLMNCVYSSSTSGTLLFQTKAILIRTGVDVISSTTNSRTSTNAAITMSSSIVNVPQVVTYDLTDTSGKINSVVVNPGDQILIMLMRGTDTSTAQARCMVYSSLISFTP